MKRVKDRQKLVIRAVDQDGQPIELLVSKINLLGIGWDVFDKDCATWPTLFDTFFQDVREISQISDPDRRFELRIPEYFNLDDEDRNRVLHASYYYTEEGWEFRLDSYRELYEGTPAEAWIDW